MKFQWALAAMAAGVLCAPLTALSQPTAEKPGFKAAEWVKQPTVHDLLVVYPAEAYHRSVEGHVKMLCEIGLDGLLHGCAVVSESPAGMGFGQAAVSLAPQFVMRPATQDGKPVLSRAVFPVHFLIDQGAVQPHDGEDGFSASMLPSAKDKLHVDPQRKLVFTAPVWASAPTHAEMAAARPASGAQGHAVLQCYFTREHTLHRCETLEERPAHAGFAKAAMALTKDFRATPEADGRPGDGDQTDVAFTFDVPGGVADTSALAKPVWRSLPTADDVIAAFPPQARAAKVGAGRVELHCVLAPNGGLADCTVGKEEPAGLGFGEAALKVAPLFAMVPWTSDGRPVDGEKIVLPIRVIDGVQPAAAGK